MNLRLIYDASFNGNLNALLELNTLFLKYYQKKFVFVFWLYLFFFINIPNVNCYMFNKDILLIRFCEYKYSN
jgi:hypothetical protein